MRYSIVAIFAFLIGASAHAQYWAEVGTYGSIQSTNAGNVGIGTSAIGPSHKLTVGGGYEVPVGVPAGLELFALDNNTAAQGSYTTQLFKFGGASWAAITATMASSTQADLVFKTKAGIGSPIERMRIAGDGTVTIPTLSVTSVANVNGSLNGVLSAFVLENKYTPTTSGHGAGMLFRYGVGEASNSWTYRAGIAGLRDGDGGAIIFRTNPGVTNSWPTEVVRIDKSGNVGVGTTVPGTKLDVVGTARMTSATVTGAATLGSATVGTATITNATINGSASITNATFNGTTTFTTTPTLNNTTLTGTTTMTTATASGTITAGSLVANGNGVVVGNMGIGTSSPTSKLHVVGNAYVTGSLTVDGNIAAKYQDVAEWVPFTQSLADASVVILDDANIGAVTLSAKSYDTRVAGVVSPQPGLLLGEAGDNRAKIATTGRVKVKVTTSNGAIAVGDLLVTSDKPGVAMRSTPVDLGGIELHRPGTLLGKAIEPLAEGDGEILVLLSLQ